MVSAKGERTSIEVREVNGVRVIYVNSDVMLPETVTEEFDKLLKGVGRDDGVIYFGDKVRSVGSTALASLIRHYHENKYSHITVCGDANAFRNILDLSLLDENFLGRMNAEICGKCDECKYRPY